MSPHARIVPAGGVMAALLVTVSGFAAGTVVDEQKISDTQGNFTGGLVNADLFGRAVTSLGDLDGDGVVDIAVGATGDQFEDDGAVWILFLDTDGTVKDQQKINQTEGGFGGSLDIEVSFGGALAALGDLDGDGVTELAVGAPGSDLGTDNDGAVWILFLNADGTVNDETLIGSGTGGFGGALSGGDRFGDALGAIGDLDGDGVPDLAVGHSQDDAIVQDDGGVWILFLNADGTVKAEQLIDAVVGGFGGSLDQFDEFGTSVASLGDLTGDGTLELAVGAPRDDDGGIGANAERGAVWILSLNDDGTVASELKISQTQGGFGGVLSDIDIFGQSLSALGDLDGDGVTELAVGAPLTDDGGVGLNANRGAVWILLLNASGTVKDEVKISDTSGGFDGILDDGDDMAYGVAGIGDLDGDGVGDLVAGAHHDGDGGFARGAVWVMFLDGVGCVADLDGSGDVGFSDLTQLLSSWGPCLIGAPCPSDFDGSGDVGFGDLTTLLGAWGPCA